MIRVSDLTLHAGDFHLDEVSFSVDAGQYAVLMGRTGTGKTTLLEAIAGLKRIDSGRIELGGVEVTAKRASERDIGYVPQDGALFSTMTVGEQLAFALLIRRRPSAEIEARVTALADMLEISHLVNRKPRGLSGGERQRVALGRAISFNPSTLLFDEPLSALDEETHAQIMALLKRVQVHTGATCLHVTHSSKEARQLADKCLRILDGKVIEEAVGG